MANDNRPIGVTRNSNPERQQIDLQETVQLLWDSKNEIGSKVAKIEKLLGDTSISRLTTALRKMHESYMPLVVTTGQSLIGKNGKPIVIDNRI